MDDPATPSPKAPWHLWVLAIAALLWNLGGAVDFVMTETSNPAYLKGLTAPQTELIHNFPVWVVVVWGVAVFGGLLGSVALLLRRRQAVCLFLTSLICAAIVTVHNFFLSDYWSVFPGAGTAIFAGAIVVAALLLFVYARAMRNRGVLR